MVAAFAPEPLGLALGVSTDTAMTLMADALDLVHRLPHTWRRAPDPGGAGLAGPPVAQKTHALNREGRRPRRPGSSPRGCTPSGSPASTAPSPRPSPSTCPRSTPPREERSRQTWDVTLHHPNPTEYAGTSELHITGDTMTLTHLYDRICATAADLKTAGDDDPLGVRKATALRTPHRHTRRPSSTCTSTRRPRRTRGRPGREARARHRRQDPRLGRPLPGHHPTRPPRWTAPIAVDAHDPPAWMRDLVILRDPPLRLPALPTRRPGLRPRPHRSRSTTPAHPDQTRPANLAPLCRRHHRAKTTGRWQYRRLPDGTYAMDRSRPQESRGSGRDSVMPVRPATYPSCSLSRRIGALPACVQV